MVDKQYILGLTQREVDSYHWRINSESKDPSYCGSTSFEHHIQQVRDPDSWVSESMLEAWEKEYIRDSEPQPTIKELQAKLDAVRKVELKNRLADPDNYHRNIRADFAADLREALNGEEK